MAAIDDDQRRQQPPSVDTGDELAAVVVVADRQDAAQEAQDGVLLEVGLVVLALDREPDRRVDEERAEDVEHPARRGDRRGAGEDEDRAQHQRQDDADVEHLVLRQAREPRTAP